MSGALIRQRLHNQRLARSALRTPAGVVAWMGAVQAQDYAGAKWAIGLRATGLTDAAVERAYDRGAILRTHVLRPTWHFVAPADIRWMLALTAPRVAAASAYQNRREGLDDRTFRGSRAVFERALRDGRHLTRGELATALARAGVTATGIRLGLLLMRAEVDGVICSGATRDRQITYALLEERVPPARALDPDEALGELTRRYFLSHGPATAADFAWWSGLTLRDARRGIAIVEPALASEAMDGTIWWTAAGRRPAAPPSPAVSLLPNWDEYWVAYRDRRALFAGGAALPAGVFSPSIVIDGTLAGTWTRTRRGRSIHLKVRPKRRLTPGEARAVETAAARYGTFMDMQVVLSPPVRTG